MSPHTYTVEQNKLTLNVYIKTQKPETLLDKLRKNPTPRVEKELIAEGKVPAYYTRRFPADIYQRLVNNDHTRTDFLTLIRNHNLYTEDQYTDSMQQLFDAVLTDNEKNRI